MNLLELVLKPEYRSLNDDIVHDFYVPVLSRSVLYQRAVGFFSSTALMEVSLGLAGLLRNGGAVQLIVSPYLQPEDIDAIQRGYEAREAILARALMSQFREPETYFEAERLNLLATLIAMERLDVKVAFTKPTQAVGMYHEKFGLVHDSAGNVVAFSGSMNESQTAFFHNYEAIDVFCSWTPDRDRVMRKQAVFRALWNNQEPRVETVAFPRVVREKLLSFRRASVDRELDMKQYPVPGMQPPQTLEGPRLPETLHLHDYQQDAIQAWEQQAFRGVFDMATGTGKTYTALAALCRLYEVVGPPLAIVIVCPFQHLVEQWIDDIRRFHMKPIVGYSASRQKDWRRRLQDAVTAFHLKAISHFTLVTTNATFATPFVRTLVDSLRGKVVLIIDEAHNFGAPTLQKLLKDTIPYRLALSATLDRHMDPEGTNRLYDYFGAKCIEYSLERAIRENHLTPYLYYPIPVYLTDEELGEYRRLTKQLSKHLRSDNGEFLPRDQAGKMLLIQRARLIAAAENKLARLAELMAAMRHANHILVYCGAATLDDRRTVDPTEIKQIDAVVDLLGNHLNMKIAKFTAAESPQEREQLKTEFADGVHLQALVAIRCLDEGVNIPAIHTAILLASSTNPKEYIQRRGRVLRTAPEKTVAAIYDFITLPRPLQEVRNYSVEETRTDIGLVRREMKRMVEFASIALNPSESDKLMRQMVDSYQLAIIGGGDVDD